MFESINVNEWGIFGLILGVLFFLMKSYFTSLLEQMKKQNEDIIDIKIILGKMTARDGVQKTQNKKEHKDFFDFNRENMYKIEKQEHRLTVLESK